MLTHQNAVSLATARRLVAIIGIVVLGQVVAVNDARAQALDNLWMKVTVNAKGLHH